MLDSNYAILNCSPERLLKIWRQVDEVCGLMRTELRPTLEEPSVIPGLGEARRHAQDQFRLLAATVLAPIERAGGENPSERGGDRHAREQQDEGGRKPRSRCRLAHPELGEG